MKDPQQKKPTSPNPTDAPAPAKPANGVLLQAVLDNTTDSMVLIGKDHKVLLLNCNIRKVLVLYFGKELQPGDDYRDFVIVDNMELYLRSFERAINGETVIVENETIAENVSIWFRYKVHPTYDSTGLLLGVTLTATDISDLKKLEIEKEQIIKQLTKRNEDLEHFSQILSHNLRGPLVTILGLGEMLGTDESGDELKLILQGIKHSAHTMDAVIKDFSALLAAKRIG
ncbi:MAG: histidine kinase dimerization/phospho-acceptor domain-containing protein [Bacteroidota bacterium]